MRPLITWMTPADNSVLDFLSGHEVERFRVPPKVVAMNTDISASHVRKRMLKLKAANLLERTGKPQGYYWITELGYRYLSGDLTKQEGDQLERFGYTNDG